VKLLLTSGGVTDTSIRDALVDLLGKPIGDSTALCIPTAQAGPSDVGRYPRSASSAACPRGAA
jgi:dipeptidase E